MWLCSGTWFTSELLQNYYKALYNIKQSPKSIQTLLWKKLSWFSPCFFSAVSIPVTSESFKALVQLLPEVNQGTSGQDPPCHIFRVSQSTVYPTRCMMKTSWATYYYNEIKIIITFCILNWCLFSWKLSPRVHAWKSCITEDSILIFTNFLVPDLATTITFFQP